MVQWSTYISVSGEFIICRLWLPDLGKLVQCSRYTVHNNYSRADNTWSQVVRYVYNTRSIASTWSRYPQIRFLKAHAIVDLKKGMHVILPYSFIMCITSVSPIFSILYHLYFQGFNISFVFVWLHVHVVCYQLSLILRHVYRYIRYYKKEMSIIFIMITI